MTATAEGISSENETSCLMPMIKLRRWGNSLAAIIPAEFARERGLREGDEVFIEFDKKAAIRRAWGMAKGLKIDAQKMKDEDRDAW